MKNNGFTLIELMIVIAIIGLLAAIAVPQYSQYTMRAKFSEVKLAVQPIKTAVDVCYQNNAGHDACNSSVFVPGIRSQVTAAQLDRAAAASLVQQVTLTGTTFPVITSISTSDEGFNGETYVITGQPTGTAGSDKTITDWIPSGTACDEGWC